MVHALVHCRQQASHTPRGKRCAQLAEPIKPKRPDPPDLPPSLTPMDDDGVRMRLSRTYQEEFCLRSGVDARDAFGDYLDCSFVASMLSKASLGGLFGSGRVRRCGRS